MAVQKKNAFTVLYVSIKTFEDFCLGRTGWETVEGGQPHVQVSWGRGWRQDLVIRPDLNPQPQDGQS